MGGWGGGVGVGGGSGQHVTGGVVSKERNSVPHSVSSCPALRWHEQTINRFH